MAANVVVYAVLVEGQCVHTTEAQRRFYTTDGYRTEFVSSEGATCLVAHEVAGDRCCSPDNNDALRIPKLRLDGLAEVVTAEKFRVPPHCCARTRHKLGDRPRNLTILARIADEYVCHQYLGLMTAVRTNRRRPPPYDNSFAEVIDGHKVLISSR